MELNGKNWFISAVIPKMGKWFDCGFENQVVAYIKII
jgi:hypothetical protein